jgi:hypothetical protein
LTIIKIYGKLPAELLKTIKALKGWVAKLLHKPPIKAVGFLFCPPAL